MYRTSKLQELVIKGIPTGLRGELWMTFSGALHQLRANPGKYAEYVSSSLDSSNIAADEIERDLHRALPEVSHKLCFYTKNFAFFRPIFSRRASDFFEKKINFLPK